MTKITYIPGEIANAAIDEQGNRKPVTRTQHIFDDAKGKSQAEVNADIDDTLALHQSEINALDSQNYVTVDSFNALPTTGAADTVYRVSNWDGTQQDPSVYSEYAWNGSQYVHLNTKTQIGEVFDISAYHATGGNLATYADLSAALDSNNGGGVPQSLRKGGMSIKYVQSSDNKYVQYRLMSDTFNTTVTNWQGIDDKPTDGSQNLVESGAVAKALSGFTLTQGSLNNTTGQEFSRTNRLRTGYIKTNGLVYCDIGEGFQYLVFFYADDVNKTFVRKESEFSLSGHQFYWDGYVRIIIGKYPDDTEVIVPSDNCGLTVIDDKGILKTGIASPLYALERAFVPQLGKVSIIGDSISTFQDAIINGYSTYYPNVLRGVVNRYETWWDMLLNAIGSQLEVNASYSGSGAAYRQGYPDFYDRATLLGSPDTIIVALGTNDSGIYIALGTYDYDSAIADLSETEFIPAYTKGVKQLLVTYPNAKIILLSMFMRPAYRTAIMNIASHYGLDFIDTSGYYTDNEHPDKIGMQAILSNILSYYSTNKDYITLNYTGNVASTRLSVPRKFRKKGLIISYFVGSDIITEQYNSGWLEDAYFGLDENWSPVTQFSSGQILNKVSISDTIYTRDNAIPSMKGTYAIAKGFLLEQGGFNSATGAETSNSRRLRSDFIKMDCPFAVTIEDGYQAMVYKYNASKEFVGRDRDFSIGTLKYNKYNGYIRLLIAKYPDDTQNLNLSDNPDVSLYKNYSKENEIFLSPISFSGTGAFILNDNNLTISQTLWVYTSKEERKQISVQAFGTIDISTINGTKRLVVSSAGAVSIKEMDSVLDDGDSLIAHIYKNDSWIYIATAGNVGTEAINMPRYRFLLPQVPVKSEGIRYFNHRGVWDAQYPESTPASVMNASIYGVRYIECDVIYTSDNHPVVMHDYTINRTMQNADGTEIAEEIDITTHTLAELQQYRYKSTNPKYRTAICTLEQYIDACITYGCIPIVQTDAEGTAPGGRTGTALKVADILLLCSKLGANWICYNGSPQNLRQVSYDVLYLDSYISNNSAELIDVYFRKLGGRCGISFNNPTTFETAISNGNLGTLKQLGYEIMASFANYKTSIPKAIANGATIVLSDNIGKEVKDIEASSLLNFNSFTYDGQVEDGILVLDENESLEYALSKEGIYNVVLQCSGEGTLSVPINDNQNVDIDITSGYIVFPILFTTENNSRKITITAGTNGLTIKEIFIKYSKN